MSHEPGRHATARDQRFASRLESFGDIVIGFSLAQLALSFVFPKVLTVLTLAPLLTAFGWTFAMTAWLWMLYRRIGDDYFVPGRLTTALYLGGLAGIVLLIFGVQLVMHYSLPQNGTLADVDLAVKFYFVVLAATLATIGAQFAIGLRTRRASIEPGQARSGLLTTYRSISMAVAVLVAAVFLPGKGVAATIVLFPTMLGGALIGRVLATRVLRRSAPE
jgi:hypothetical protein